MTATVPDVALSRILCPTDFSPFSAAAVSYAAALGHACGATVHLLHVATPFPIVAPYLDAPGDPRLFEALRTQIDEGLAADAARLRDAGLTVTVEQRTGSARHEILEAADEQHADLIVLGTHGRSGFERLVLGSVAEKILRLARCAVLTVPRGALAASAAALPWRQILCAHDGSPSSETGVRYAAALAERTGARLTLLHVVEVSPADTDAPEPEVAAMRAAREQRAREMLTAALPAAARGRGHVDDLVVSGAAGPQILATAHTLHPDLIVMGVHGRGAIDLLLSGSTVNQVVRQAEQPVLTVRLPRTGE